MDTLRIIFLILFAFPTYAECIPSLQTINLIQEYEGFIPFVYDDVGRLGTIGFGHLILRGEKFDEPLLPDAAQKLLERDLMKIMGSMNGYIHIRLNENQCSGLSSLSFNIGANALGRSTLLKFTNQDRHSDAAKQFLVWNKVRINGVLTPVTGLTRRRIAESNLYMRQP